MITIKQTCQDIELDPKQVTRIYCEHGGDPNYGFMLDRGVYYYPCQKCMNALIGIALRELVGDLVETAARKGHFGLPPFVGKAESKK